MSSGPSSWDSKFRRAKNKLGAHQAFIARKAHQGIDPGFEDQPPPSDEPPAGLGIQPSQQGGESSAYFNNHPQAAQQPPYQPAQQYSSQPLQYSPPPQPYSQPSQPYSSPPQQYSSYSSPQQQYSTLPNQSPPANSSPPQQPSSSRQYSPSQQFSSPSSDYSLTMNHAPPTYNSYSYSRPDYQGRMQSYPPDSSGPDSFVNPSQPRYDPYDNNVTGWNNPSASSVGNVQPQGQTFQRSSTMHENQYPTYYGQSEPPGLPRSWTEPISCPNHPNQSYRTCTVCRPASNYQQAHPWT